MKTVFIVALLLISIFFLASVEVVEASINCSVCIGDLKSYNLNWRSSNGEQGTDCVELCFFLGTASLLTCSGHSGEFIAEDLTTDRQNYVGEIDGDPCHIRLRKYTLRDVLDVDCVHINFGTELWHARGVLIDGCECGFPP